MHRLLAHFCFGVAAPFSVACVLVVEPYRRAVRNLAVSGSRSSRGSLERRRALSTAATLSLQRIRGLASSALRLVHTYCVPSRFLPFLAHFVWWFRGTVFRPIADRISSNETRLSQFLIHPSPSSRSSGRAEGNVGRNPTKTEASGTRVERVKQKSAKIGKFSLRSVWRTSAAPLEKELDPGFGGGNGTRCVEVRARKQQRQAD